MFPVIPVESFYLTHAVMYHLIYSESTSPKYTSTPAHKVLTPAGLCEVASAHHDGLGQAAVRRADGAQRSSKQPALVVGERGRGQGQAVQLAAGAPPEGPVDQRPLSLERLLLSRLCRDTEEEEESCGLKCTQTAAACVSRVEITRRRSENCSMIHPIAK